MLILLLSFLLEIQSVVYRYNPQTCNQLCANMLEKELRSYPSLAGFRLNPDEGRVVLYWKPNFKFSYQHLKNLLQRIGLGFFNPFEMTVRGTVTTRGKDIFLVSIGDNSTFLLLGPAPRSQTNYVTRGNLALHQLQEPLISRLKEAELHHRMVEVRGELYMPEAPFAPPDKLIIDKLTVIPHD